MKKSPCRCPQNVPWAPLAGIMTALALFGGAQGFSYPLLTLAMQDQGRSSLYLGLSASMMPLGMLVAAPLTPIAARAIGDKQLAVLCALVCAGSFALIGWLQSWIGWFALRLLLGFAVAPLYILGEVWVLSLATKETRGQLIGVFNMIVGVGYATGPLLVAVSGFRGWLPFVIASATFVCCSIILMMAPGNRDDVARGPAEDGSAWRFLTIAPLLVATVGVTSANQQALYTLFPVFANEHGIQGAIASQSLAVLSFGTLLLQYPLGRLADRFGPRALIVACATVASVGIVGASSLIQSSSLWLALFVLGGASYGLYTVTLLELGDRFSGRLLLSGNAAFAFAWGVGGSIGAPMAGAMMHVLGPLGLPATVAPLYVVVGYLFAFRYARP